MGRIQKDQRPLLLAHLTPSGNLTQMESGFQSCVETVKTGSNIFQNYEELKVYGIAVIFSNLLQPFGFTHLAGSMTSPVPRPKQLVPGHSLGCVRSETWSAAGVVTNATVIWWCIFLNVFFGIVKY